MIDPGFLSTVQDGGRVGLASIGVPRAGAADTFAAAIANRAVGNFDDAPALEVTLRGPMLRFASRRWVACSGDADVVIDGWPVARGVVHPVEAGQHVAIGALGSSARTYLAVSGGIETPTVLGSRSSDLLCEIGPSPLEAGDQRVLGVADRGRGRARGQFDAFERSTKLRVLAGPHGRGSPQEGAGTHELIGPDGPAGPAFDRLLATEYEVGPDSDRTGVRLEPRVPGGSHLRPGVVAGPAPHRSAAMRGPAPAAGIPGSVPVVTGAVQPPPDGRPIVLGVDHGTLGGYPLDAVIAAVDRSRLGQLRPGDRIRFEAVEPDEAARLYRRAEQQLSRLVSGWFPVQAG